MPQIFIRQLNLTSLPHVPGSNMSPGYRRERLWTDPGDGVLRSIAGFIVATVSFFLYTYLS